MTSRFGQMRWWERLETMSQAGAIPKGQYGATLDLATAPWSVAALPQAPQAPQAQGPTEEKAASEGGIVDTLKGIGGGIASAADAVTPDALGRFAGEALKFGEPVLNALSWAYRELSSEVISPLVHAPLVLGDLDWYRKIGAENAWDVLLDGRTWEEVWRRGDEESWGRGLVLNAQYQRGIFGDALKGEGIRPLDHDRFVRMRGEGVLSDGTKYYDEEQAFRFNAASGYHDFLGVMFLDPLYVGGKAVSSLRLLRTTKKSADTIARAENFDEVMEAEPTARFLRWTDGKDATTIARHSALRNSPQAGLIADLLSKASTYDKDLIYRISLGDAKAFAELQVTAPDIAAQYVRMKGAHRHIELEVLPTSNYSDEIKEGYLDSLADTRQRFREVNRTQLKLAETEFIPEGSPFEVRWLTEGDPLVRNTYATVYRPLPGAERMMFSPTGVVERSADDIEASMRQFEEFREAARHLKAADAARVEIPKANIPVPREVIGQRPILGMPRVGTLQKKGAQQAQTPRLFDDLESYHPGSAEDYAARMGEQLNLIDDWVTPELTQLNSRGAFFTRAAENAADVVATPTKTGIFGQVDVLPKGGAYATIAEKKAEFGAKVAMATKRRKRGDLWHLGWGSRPAYVLHSLAGDVKEGLSRGNTPATYSPGNPEGWRTIDAWLKRVRGLQPETRMEWVRKFMGATNEQEKLGLVEAMEGTIIKHLLRTHNVRDNATIEQIVANTMGSKKAVFGRMADEAKARAEQAAIHGTDPSSYNAVRPATLAADGTALVPTAQLVKQLLNEHPLLDVELLDKAFRRDRTVLQSLLPSSKIKDPIMETATWTGRLWKLSVLARVGYSVRTVSDEVLLGSTALASMMYMAGALPGLGRLLASQPARVRNIPKRVKNYRAKNSRDLPERELEEIPHQRGMKPVEVAPGVWSHGIYDGPTGSVTRALTSADQRRMFGVYDDILTTLRTKTNWGALDPKDPTQELSWLKAATHALNNQLGRDVVARKFLRGETEEEVLTWMKSAEGRNYLKRLGPIVQANREDWLRGVAAMVDQYTLGDEALMRMALEGKVTPQTLRGIPIDKRMPVHGGQIEFALGTGGLADLLNSMGNGFYNVMSKLPTDALVRHPVADLMYQTKLRELVAVQEAQGVRMIERPDRLYQLEEIARQRVVKEMDRIFKDNLFSSPQTALKFAMPFFGAWRASIARWATQVGENPWFIARANQGWQGLHKPFDVVNEDGVLIEDSDDDIYGFNTKNKIVVRLPRGLSKMFGGTEEFAPGREIPLKSFNTVLQGDPWYNPGFGPFVTVPVASIVRDKPKAAELMKELGVLPLGARDNWKQHALPTTWQRFIQEAEGVENRQWVNTYVNIARVEYTRYSRKEREKPPTKKEIREKTKNLTKLRIFEALFSPVSTQPMFYAAEWESKVPKEWQFLAGKLRDYKSRLGNEAGEATFLEEFPEAWLYMESTSKNNSGIPANHESWAKSRKFPELASIAPDIFDSAVGIEDHEYGKFDQAVYDAQMTTVWDPETGRKYREVRDPSTLAEEAAKGETWRTYSKVMEYLRAQLSERKLLTFNDAGAEDLKSKRSLIVDELSKQDPAWGREYGSPDPDRAYRIREQAWLVANDPRLRTDPHRTGELQTLKDYLSIRQWFVQQLAERDAAGGSATLTAQANRDLLEKWDQIRDAAAESNTRFSEIWMNRYFANDYIQESK